MLIAVPISGLTLVELFRHDLSLPADVSHLIGYSVRFAVPLIYLVVVSSALPVLWPNRLTRWLLRNRKYIGLCFAVAMAWQGLFIAIMSNFQREYYYEEIFYLRDELEGSTGYLFLAAMVVTTFQAGRMWLTPPQWKLLHKSGMYFLWAYPFSVYWWNLFYYQNPQPIDYVFYWSGFLAVALRIFAWGARQHRAATHDAPSAGIPNASKILGSGLILAGIVAAATGLLWQHPLTEFLLAPAWSANLVLWLPFWPFEPFLPLFAIGMGAWVMTRRRRPPLAVPAGA